MVKGRPTSHKRTHTGYELAIEYVNIDHAVSCLDAAKNETGCVGAFQSLVHLFLLPKHSVLVYDISCCLAPEE